MTSGREKIPQTVLLDSALKQAAGSLFSPESPEPFAALEYPKELEIKNRALQLFLRANRLNFRIPEIVPAVLPRHYRANSKRKCSLERGKFTLSHAGGGTGESLLEPDFHCRIYEYLADFFGSPRSAYAAQHLNWCVLRGAVKTMLILNLDRFDGPVIRTMKILAERLKQTFPELLAFFLYLDETRSDYYLETKRPGHKISFKKMYGVETLSIPLPSGRRLLFPPTVFSQSNEAMIGKFLGTAEQLLNPAEGTLIDLYCGCGMISLAMADKVRAVVGVELEGEAVDAAAKNASFLFPGKNIRFLRGIISPALLRKGLPPPSAPEFLVLDPPRSGTVSGVIGAAAVRSPERALHIFCGTDNIPHALHEWHERHYEVSRAVTLDMFPGTASLETMILLEKRR